MRPIVLATLATLAACTTTPEQEERAAATKAETEDALAAELAGLVPGEPTDCLPPSSRTQMSTKGYGSTIVYRVSSDLKYRTDTSGCEGVGRDDILVTSTPIGRTCRGDIAQTFDRTSRIPTGSCSFGSFTPYRRP